jgi:hypothetical protein
LEKIIHYWYRGKNSPNICDTSIIINPLPKVNNRPIVENSPNLVTLDGNSAVELKKKKPLIIFSREIKLSELSKLIFNNIFGPIFLDEVI